MTHFDQAFLGEHREMETRLKNVGQHAAQGEWRMAASVVESQKAHLLHHIDVEERVVYPAFESQTDDEGRRTLAFLRKRHLELPVFFDELADAIADHDEESLNDTLETLLRIIADHHQTEEKDVFPYFEPTAPLETVGIDAARALEEGR
ncbi:hypothetical protein BI364_08705 [Acidihalobacter yilgarnensis]|uniref:Hemerythrin-like domain-containing protein n=1 Tax=Acidihalobacter yilgarnensis TaxID=2819280 RepID=A0A1D8INH9_9GAMM|nr:hemerythrin domain-containing protein [Acidihalobacter yilgarnensis]AOU98030.1 hypothetical protein BI364_08705 [Acidihalobacter yilgarnensis]